MTRPAKNGETTRIYVVEHANTGAETLVRTSAASIAIRHVVSDTYGARIATQRDLERLLPKQSVIDLTTTPSQPELVL